MVDKFTLKIIEVTDPYNPVETCSIDTYAESVSIMEKDGKIYALVTMIAKGLKIIDITDP